MPVTPSEKEPNEKGWNRPMWFRLRGTVVLRIWWQIVAIMIYDLILVICHEYVPGMRFEFSSTLVGLLGIVLALLLAFRTQAAYEVYSEGRNLWASMTIHIRTISMCVWTGVAEEDGKDVIGKVTCLNLLLAYAVSIKHHLREEYFSDYNDIRELVSAIPEFVRRPYERPSTEKRNDMSFVAHCISPPTNIPIQILYYIKSYLTSVSENAKLAKSSSRSVQEAMKGLIECFTGFEKILNTPLPLAYSVHLHHILWIFILTMPIQLMQELVWWTIPVVGLTSFSLLGILGINWEIDNPFGYDYNDLPLDEYCTVLTHEIKEITFNRIRNYDDWVFTPKNIPMWPLSAKNAADVSHYSKEQVHELLIKCANSDSIQVNSANNAGHDNPGYH